MEELLGEVVKQVPALAVLGFIVVRFLAEMSKAREQHLEHEIERDKRLEAALERTDEACHEVQRDSIAIMRETKEEMGRSREATRELLEFLRRRPAA